MNITLALAAALLLLPASASAAGNERIASYSEARKLFDEIHADHRETIYCGFKYDSHKSISLPRGFDITLFPDRAGKMEREHVVPAENFGRAFREWREGSPLCIDGSGHAYKGRKCAETASPRFNMMEADLHNLFPSVGSVNAARSNYNFEELGAAAEPFGPTCPMKLEGRKAEPPARAKGMVARAYLYMDREYPEYHMSAKQKRLMEQWDAKYPPDAWECQRNRRIQMMQGNDNPYITRRCDGTAD